MQLVLSAALLAPLLAILPVQSEYLDIPIEIREFHATLLTNEHSAHTSAVEQSTPQEQTELDHTEQDQSVEKKTAARLNAQAQPYYQISCRIDYHLNDHMRQALRNGVSVFSEFRIKLIKHSDWWFNDTHILALQRYSLQYHELSKKYILTALGNEGQHLKQWNFTALPSALKQMGGVEQLNLPPLDVDLSQGDYALFAEAELKEETPELPLSIQSWFSSRKQNLKSEGIMWLLP